MLLWVFPCSELLKAADLQTHVCAKFSRMWAHFAFWAQQWWKWQIFFFFWPNLKKFSLNLTCFYGIFSACLCSKFYFENSVCAKDFAFRRSAPVGTSILKNVVLKPGWTILLVLTSQPSMRSLCPDHFGAQESFLHTWRKTQTVAKCGPCIWSLI